MIAATAGGASEPSDTLLAGKAGGTVAVRRTLASTICRITDPTQLGVLVAAIVVEDHVDQSPGRDVAFEAVQKAQKFMVPMALHVLPDNRAVKNIERGKQRRRPVADVIVGHRSGAPALHRQTRLGSVECLDLALLVDREHQAVRRRVDVEADDIAQFGGKLGSRLSLKTRSRCGARPWACHSFCTVLTASPIAAAIARLVQWVVSPGGGPRVRSINAATRGRGLAGLARLVAQQRVDPGLHKPALPPPDVGFRDTVPAYDLRRAAAFGRRQNDPRPPYVFRIPAVTAALRSTR